MLLTAAGVLQGNVRTTDTYQYYYKLKLLISSARERGVPAEQLRELLVPAVIVILQLSKVKIKDKLSHLDELL